MACCALGHPLLETIVRLNDVFIRKGDCTGVVFIFEGRGMRDARCEMRDARCEMRDARCEMRTIISSRHDRCTSRL